MAADKNPPSPNKNGPMSYEDARELARHSDSNVRRELAERDDVKPEILYYLAGDDDPEVRRAIAANRAAPRKADLLLAKDNDHEVRIGMAEKIALLAPGLTSDEQDAIRIMTYQALGILARDQMTRVRQIVSETLKDVTDAPPEVILQLAHDAELVVSAPVLEFSPVLSVDDLLEIIASKPVNGALKAVSRRHHIGEAVSDAISESDDHDAIAELLGNNSAQIREETLDHLIDRAVDVESLQNPLVKRVRLPAGAAGRLAHFVADSLLDILTAREDLDPATAKEVRSIVARRLNQDAAERVAAIPAARMKEVRELHAANTLDADRLNSALQSGDIDFAAAALVLLSGLSERAVMMVISRRDVRGVIAIAWKAKLEPWLLEQLQLKLCRIPTHMVISPPRGRKFPLGDKEMAHQLTLIENQAQ